MEAILLQETVRPVTGYLLCYIPLATVIIGLITLFVLTDRHASRPYLRYNPFVAVDPAEQERVARTPTVGETPAGPLAASAGAGETAVFLGEHGATAVVPKDAVPPSVAPDRPASLSGAPPADVPKDLGRITGIDLPDVDQRAQPLTQPPQNVAPPSAAEMPAASAAATSSADAVARPTGNVTRASVPAQAAASAADAATTLPAAATTPAQAAAAQALAITYVEFAPAGSDIDGEYVVLVNNTNSAINMSGWTLRDDAQKHSFSFPSFMVAPGAIVQLWSKAGKNDAANLYWGQRGAVWNNTGDTAVLLDADGKEVSRFSYEAKK